MTDHSLEELERQVQQAFSRLMTAENEHRVAAKRLHDRRCRESGYMGKVVSSNQRKVLVQDVEFGSRGAPWAVKGFKLKNDGTAGNAICRVWVDSIVDVSPYAHPTPSQNITTKSEEGVR